MNASAKLNFYDLKLPNSINLRPSTTFNSPRSISTALTSLDPNQNPKKMPYSGLSIGLLSIQRRSPEEKLQTIQPTTYTHYFADIYLNSETISFPKIESEVKFEVKEKYNFCRPAKCNFRRLKKKSWKEPRMISGVEEYSNAFVARSAGKSCETQSKRRKELIPLTKFTAKKVQPEVLGLKIRRLIKPFE